LKIQARIFKFINIANWALLAVISSIGYMIKTPNFAMGILCGGLIVTINFHLLYRTINKALTPPHVSSFSAILVKYYLRFFISAVIIFILILGHYVDPIGLTIGLSIVVMSITIAAVLEAKKLICEETV